MLLTEELLKTFNPPTYILEEIEFDEEMPYIVRICSGEHESPYRNTYYVYLETLIIILKEKYGERWEKWHTQQVVSNIFHEHTINSIEHGNKYDSEKYVTACCWMGEKGILFGIRDEGDFYKKSLTKERLEARKGFSSTRSHFGGAGTNRKLQRHVDSIHVDIKTGTLYLSYSFIAKNRTVDWSKKA